MRRFLRPSFRRPLPVRFVPTHDSVYQSEPLERPAPIAHYEPQDSAGHSGSRLESPYSNQLASGWARAEFCRERLG